MADAEEEAVCGGVGAGGVEEEAERPRRPRDEEEEGDEDETPIGSRLSVADECCSQLEAWRMDGVT